MPAFQATPGSVNVVVMRRSASRVWAMSFTLAFALLLAFAWQQQGKHHAGQLMSAPSAPRTSIGSPALHTIVREHFDPPALPQSWMGGTFTPTVSRYRECAGSHVRSTVEYDPLHRRPPPAIS